MKATEVIRRRIWIADDAFAEIVLWHLPKAAAGSTHRYKYRYAYVVRTECVLRYDNEAGKGDHRHYAGREVAYRFESPEKLMADFRRDIARWNRENRDS